MTKKIIPLFLFTSAFFFSQNITFPDANLKNALVNTQCVDNNNDGTPDADADTNNDGEISSTEANTITNLILYNQNISNIAGLNSFQNLLSLELSQNNLTNFDFQLYPNLQYIYLNDNQVTSININGNNVIKEVWANDNLLTNVQIKNCANLEWLSISQNAITNLQTENLNNLKQLFANSNQISSLSLINIPALQNLTINNNLLTSLNFSNSGQNLNKIWCQDNLLTSINLSNMLYLQSFKAFNNNLQNVTLANNSALTEFWAENNMIASLDFSQCPLINYIYVDNNQLTYLNVKNSHHESVYSICGNPNLNHICIDNTAAEIQHMTMQTGASFCNYQNVNIDVNCSNILSTAEINDSKLSIYPNPVVNFLYLNGNFSPNFSVQIYDNSGKLVWSQSKVNKKEIDLSTLSAGNYLIKITDANGKNLNSKFIKK